MMKLKPYLIGTSSKSANNLPLAKAVKKNKEKHIENISLKKSEAMINWKTKFVKFSIDAWICTGKNWISAEIEFLVSGATFDSFFLLG